jgi:hypothetical protein
MKDVSAKVNEILARHEEKTRRPARASELRTWADTYDAFAAAFRERAQVLEILEGRAARPARAKRRAAGR